MIDEFFILWTLRPLLKAGWGSYPKLKLISFNYTVWYLVSPNSDNKKYQNWYLKICFSVVHFMGLFMIFHSALSVVFIHNQTSKWMDGNSLLWQENPPSHSQSAPCLRIGGQAVKYTSAHLFAPSLEVSDPCAASPTFINKPSCRPLSIPI